MNEKPFFSIIAPVYNVQNYLDKCIESVNDQKFKDYELILIDDGSTDKSKAICDFYACKYQRIVCVHQENAGLSEARNTGIRKAKGEYIVFLDSDDMLSKNALHNLYEVIQKNNEPDWVISRRETLIDGEEKVSACQYVFEEEKFMKLSRAELYREIQKFSDCLLGVWIFTVKRVYLINENLFFYPKILHEDEEWVPRLFFSKGQIAFNNSFLYVYRMERKGSITAGVNVKRMFDRILICDLLKLEFSQSKYSTEEIDVVRQRRCSIIFGLLCQLDQYRQDEQFACIKDQIEERYKLLKHSKKVKHRLAYYFSRVFGVDCASRILSNI